MMTFSPTTSTFLSGLPAAPDLPSFIPPKKCIVVPTRSFSILVNLILGFVSLSCLLLKRTLAKTDVRTRALFVLDVGRLFVAGSLGHLFNIASAWLLNLDGQGDECAFYLLNHTLDFLLGTPLSFFVLYGFSIFEVRMEWSALLSRGFYGDPPSLAVWVKQTLEFTVALLVSKSLLAIPLFWFHDDAKDLGLALVAPFKQNPRLELVLVMVLVPVTLNSIQILIFDQLLMRDDYEALTPRHSHRRHIQHHVESTSLLRRKSDDEGFAASPMSR